MPKFVTIDRIWELTGPLQSGARISWRNREVTLGGGGYFTGLPFLKLKHDVALVSSLGNDALGSEARQFLATIGFDMRHVMTRDAATHLTEIFLEPSGERTIDRKAAMTKNSIPSPSHAIGTAIGAIPAELRLRAFSNS